MPEPDYTNCPLHRGRLEATCSVCESTKNLYKVVRKAGCNTIDELVQFIEDNKAKIERLSKEE